MTVAELLDRATLVPTEVRASRRRAAILRMLRIVRQQRERELLELGYLELGGEAG